jgi:hypothetical protein
MKTDEMILQQLRAATDGLLFMSESDYPFECVVWPGPLAPTPETVGLWHGAGENPPETDSFARMFRAPTTEHEGITEEVRRRVRRYRALVALLQENLTQIQVTRLGGVHKTVYVLGLGPNGNWLGLKTQVIET